MLRPIVAISIVLPAVACGVARPLDASVDPRVEATATADPNPLPSTPKTDRFPGGPGVTLLHDQLTDLYRDATVSSSRVPYKERVAAAANALGVAGEETEGATVWRAVGAKHVGGPYHCWELAVLERGGMQVTGTDRRYCGLPYGERDAKAYTGPGPRWTKLRLERLLAEVRALPPDEAEGMVRAKLGSADSHGVIEKHGTTPSVNQWSSIGARGDDAPITCHVLVLGKERPRIEQRDLSDCGIVWPPPASAYDTGPTPPPAIMATANDECTTKCPASDACVIEQRVAKNATTVVRGDRTYAYGSDGRPGPVSLVTSCTPIPPSCSPVNSSCFFAPPPRPGPSPLPPIGRGPCPAKDNYGYSFRTANGGRPVITCYSRSS